MNSTRQIITPEYFNLPGLAQFCGLGVRTLRDAIKSREHPLPHFRVGHKTILVSRVDIIQWLKKYRTDEKSEIDQAATQALAGIEK